MRRRATLHAASLCGPGILHLGIGDDCAILRPAPRDEIAITTDLFLEKVHFRRDWHQPEVAGHRCLARGLSDLAAMGATPAAAFLSCALPPELTGVWARRFVDGLLRLARLHNVTLAGGDTARAPLPDASLAAESGMSPIPPLAAAGALFTADIVLVGTVRRAKALLRSGARPGDSIYVTGELGGAAAELRLLEQTPESYTRLLRARGGHPHLFPQPRIAVGQSLLGRASAAIDLSDGLSTDLAHLCDESAVAAEIEASLLPIHPLARLCGDSLELALHGGEDYELLFTASAKRRLPAELRGTAIHRIGRIVEAGRRRPRVILIDADGSQTPLENRGWEHFRKSQ